MIHRAGHVRQEVGVAVGVARHQWAQLDPLRHLGHGGQHRPALEVLAVRIATEGEEVVPVEERIHPQRLGPRPRLAHLSVLCVLRLNVRSYPYGHFLLLLLLAENPAKPPWAPIYTLEHSSQGFEALRQRSADSRTYEAREKPK